MIDNIIHTILLWILMKFRPIVKWFLRQTTRLCELQRICYGETPGAPRSIAVESSLTRSQSPEIFNVCQTLKKIVRDSKGIDEKAERAAIDAAINVILTTKKIKRELHKQFVQSLRACLTQIYGYKGLMEVVESIRAICYDSDNLEHEKKLVELWELLRPDFPLQKRVTKQWQDVGFQGEDPKTDFRGMGILGLENLLYFAREFNSPAKHILSHSHHPKHGYSFAIVGINITHMAYTLLQDGSLKSHLWNVTEGRNTIDHFHHFYSYLFIEFDKFWLSEKPKDIMEFNRIRDLFENDIRNKLRDSNIRFKINIVIDTV
ncbi:ELMOD [Lepeophtheirus salmonis]|uniref:ELMOD n=1 Tax=Lepeophtheirus salmonis TaxID=72036 RepID=A0A7R8CUV2_LEPSM|nr:ELMOD [Lepeophtheirus salmonis]CAF2939714.1 ELMOD [Lepeophtheirus salmonis]